MREVARFAVQNAEEVLHIFEEVSPLDARPRSAIDAAWEFANGATRGRIQRVTALDAHRAARESGIDAAMHAARAAGDAAAAAYLHPFAKAEQVGHILRSAAHAAAATELVAGDPRAATAYIERAAARATPILIDVLRRYPPAVAGRTRVAVLMKLLDSRLRSR